MDGHAAGSGWAGRGWFLSRLAPMANTNKLDLEDDGIHRAQDKTRRYPKDAALREHGFEVHARPAKGEAQWTRGGKVYTQSEALAALPKEVRMFLGV